MQEPKVELLNGEFRLTIPFKDPTLGSGKSHQNLKIPKSLLRGKLPEDLKYWVEFFVLRGHYVRDIYAYPIPVDQEDNPIMVTIFCQTTCLPLAIINSLEGPRLILRG